MSPAVLNLLCIGALLAGVVFLGARGVGGCFRGLGNEKSW
ncbi:hypothetical protein [Proteus mirabilis]|nr:hypothetical protein [Proteus mirabilis]